MNLFLALFKKEWKTFFNAPGTYGVMAGFTVLMGFFFSSLVFTLQDSSIFTYLCANIAVMNLFFCPLFSMRLLSDEKNNRTDELILTSPVPHGLWIVSKFTAVLAVYWTVLGLFLGVCATFLALWGVLNLSFVTFNVLGLLCQSAALLALGVWGSGQFKTPASASIIGFIVALFFWISGGLTSFLNSKVLEKVGSAVSMYDHFQAFLWGPIRCANGVYFLGWVILFLALASLNFSIKTKLTKVYCTVAIVLLVWISSLVHFQFNFNSQIVEGDDSYVNTIVRNLKNSYEVLIFAPSQSSQYPLLKKWSKTLSNSVRGTLIDPQKDPLTPAKWNVSESGIVVVGRNQKQFLPLESLFSSKNGALVFEGDVILGRTLQALDQGKKRIGLLQNHGEKSPYVKQGEGISDLADTLVKYQFEVRLFSQIPTQNACDVLIVAGPKSALSSVEADQLHRFIESGAAVVLALDPFQDPSWNTFTKVYGISLVSAVVQDPAQANFMNPLNVLPNREHVPIFERFKKGAGAPVLSVVAPLTLQTTQLAIPTVFLTLSNSAWASLKGDTNFQNGDLVGPFVLGALAETKSRGRVLVLGDSDWMGNALFITQANQDLFLASIFYLSHQQPWTPLLGNISRFTLSTFQLGLVYCVVLGVFPLLWLGLGFKKWLQRKK